VRGADDGIELTGTVAADAGGADLLAVACRVRGSAALALVPAGSSGYKWHGESWPYTVELTGVPVAARDVLRRFGGDGCGPLAKARIRQAAYLLGLATGMHLAAVRYTGTRRQFGSWLRDQQAVAFPLAHLAAELRATRMLVYRAAWLAEQGSATGGRPGTGPVEALAAAAETLTEMARVTMQACGARGMTSEVSVHRYYRLAAVEPFCYGRPSDLWRLAGAGRLAAVDAVGQPA